MNIVEKLSLRRALSRYYNKEKRTYKKMELKMEIIKAAAAARGNLTYQLIKTDEQTIPVYGIRIASDFFGKREELLVSDVTCEKEKAQVLFDLCFKNTVLPSDLSDICMEFIMSEAIVA
jgi:hypothetical protein